MQISYCKSSFLAFSYLAYRPDCLCQAWGELKGRENVWLEEGMLCQVM
jgi:hypothetical protein